jgi:hypothetical protein
VPGGASGASPSGSASGTGGSAAAAGTATTTRGSGGRSRVGLALEAFALLVIIAAIGLLVFWPYRHRLFRRLALTVRRAG